MDRPVAVGLGQKLWEIVRGRETVTRREAQWLEVVDSQAVMDPRSL